MTCVSNYTLNNSTNQCEFCDLSCSSVPITDCSVLDSSNTLNICNLTNCNCLTCDDTYAMDSLNTCVLCSSLIPNCSACANLTSNPICTACLSTHDLNNSTYQCEFCDLSCSPLSMDGCTNIDSSNTLRKCNITNCNCLSCNSSYNLDSNYACIPCADLIGNCSTCSNATSNLTCLTCVSTHSLNNATNQCDFCDLTCNPLPLLGCAVLDVNNTLRICNLTDCKCLACDITYDIDSNYTCALCSATIDNCSTCTNMSINNATCTSCLSTHDLNPTFNRC